MILSFREQFKNCIISGKKIHTIREDKNNRWGPSKQIQFATGVRTKKYNCFKEAPCISTQQIRILYAPMSYVPIVMIDNKKLCKARR